MLKGSIRKQGQNSWQIRFCLGKDPLTGKYIRKQYTYRATPGKTEKEQLKEVEIEKARLLVILSGDESYASMLNITLGDYLNQKWLPDHVEQNLKPSTITWYKMLCRVHIVPEIGTAKLNKITSLQIEEFFIRLKKKGISDYTIKDLYICLNSAFECAITWGFLKINPLKGLRKYIRELNKRVKVKIKKSRKIWNIEEAVVLLNYSKEIIKPKKSFNLWYRYRYLVYLLALTNGLRRGEINGLKWEDIDLDKKIIRIKQTIGENTDEENEDGDGVKSLDSDRKLLLADFTVAEFKRILVMQEEDKKRAGRLYKDEGWVFANALGDPIYPSTISHNFQKDRENLKLPKIKFHELRHTAATLLYEYFEVPLDIVGMMLGHSSFSFTQETYLHPSPKIFKPAIEKINQELERRLNG